MDDASSFQRDTNAVVEATTSATAHDSPCHMAANDQRPYVWLWGFSLEGSCTASERNSHFEMRRLSLIAPQLRSFSSRWSSRVGTWERGRVGGECSATEDESGEGRAGLRMNVKYEKRDGTSDFKSGQWTRSNNLHSVIPKWVARERSSRFTA